MKRLKWRGVTITLDNKNKLCTKLCVNKLCTKHHFVLIPIGIFGVFPTKKIFMNRAYHERSETQSSHIFCFFTSVGN